jgi:hypothetical protein
MSIVRALEPLMERETAIESHFLDSEDGLRGLVLVLQVSRV